MTELQAQFSEREFELAYNAEFCKKNASTLIGAPKVPSQQVEGDLGYDVQFSIAQGGYSASLFLQHKICDFITKARGDLAKVRTQLGGDFYRFKLIKLDRSRQHNLLVELANAGEEVYYCAPVFWRALELHNFFRDGVVLDNSRFVNPLHIGLITDLDQHQVCYDQAGTRGYFLTEPHELPPLERWERRRAGLRRRKIDQRYVDELLRTTTAVVEKGFGASFTVPEKVEKEGAARTVAYILATYLSVQWYVIPTDALKGD